MYFFREIVNHLFVIFDIIRKAFSFLIIEGPIFVYIEAQLLRVRWILGFYPNVLKYVPL